MGHSTLNRLVVGSIPTASTNSPFTINALSTTKRARKEPRPSAIVVFVDGYRSTLVILWSYRLQILRFTCWKKSGICYRTVKMILIDFLNVSPYLLLRSFYKEPPHEENQRHCPRSLARSCRSRGLRPRHTQPPQRRAQSEPYPRVSSAPAKLHPGQAQGQVVSGPLGVL